MELEKVSAFFPKTTALLDYVWYCRSYLFWRVPFRWMKLSCSTRHSQWTCLWKKVSPFFSILDNPCNDSVNKDKLDGFLLHVYFQILALSPLNTWNEVSFSEVNSMTSSIEGDHFFICNEISKATLMTQEAYTVNWKENFH